jgi:transforming growth factor-beta-induced protein
MSRLRPTRILALVLALVLVTAACGTAEERAIISSGNNPVTAERDIVDTAVDAGFRNLASALEAAQLVETLRGEGPFTVFAPTDAAFAELPVGLLEALLEPANRGLLTDILTYHVAEGRHLSPALLADGEVTTLEGSVLTVESTEVRGDDPDATPTLEVEVGGEATATGFDQLATNGVIHVIDTVLIPPDRSNDLAAVIDEIPETTDLVSTLEARGGFTTLLGHLEATGLDAALDGDGAFTIFAPTDRAFRALTDAQRSLLSSDADLAEAVLSFHVLRGEVRTTDIFTRRQFTTLEGQGGAFARILTYPEVDEDADEDAEAPAEPPTISFTYAGIEVTITDIEATNGVIHVIDAVAIPDSARGPGGF